jgi:hypothetical protein
VIAGGQAVDVHRSHRTHWQHPRGPP